MSFKFQYGDIAVDKVTGEEIYVRGVNGNKVLFAWTNKHTGEPTAVNITVTSDPVWAERIMRNGERVWPEATPEFKFGDKIIRNDCPREEAVVGVYVGNGKVVFDYESGPSLTELYKPERFKVID